VKNSTKFLMLVIFMDVLLVPTYGATNRTTTDLGLLPFASLDVGSTTVEDETEMIGGFSIGSEYTVYTEGAFSSNSKLTLKMISREENNLFYQTEVEGTALMVGQTANYDFALGGLNFQVYGQGEIGYGKISSSSSYEISMFGQNQSGKAEGSAGSVIADASIGLRYYMDNNMVPFIAGGYRMFKVTGIEYEGEANLAANLPKDIDMSSAYASVGLGYQF